MSLSRDNRRLAVAEEWLVDRRDGRHRIVLWDIVSRTILKSAAEDALVVALSPSGGMLAVGGSEVKMLDANTFALTSNLPMPEKGMVVTALGFTPDGRLLAANDVYRPHRLFVWDVLGRRIQFTIDAGRHVRAMAFSPDSRWLAVALNDPPNNRRGEIPAVEIAFWNLASGKEQIRYIAPPVGAYCLAFNPDSRTLASGGSEVLLWSAPE